jgi:hypothetical protein
MGWITCGGVIGRAEICDDDSTISGLYGASPVALYPARIT